MADVSIYFGHGLGDNANFVHMLPLWIRRGHTVSVQCSPDKACLYQAAGAKVADSAEHVHDWPHPWPAPMTLVNGWTHNKTGCNLVHRALPNIGTQDELWPELLNVKLDLSPFVTGRHRDKVDLFLKGLPRPLVVCHFDGNTSSGNKSVPKHHQTEIVKGLLRETGGSVVMLDWDKRSARVNSFRFKCSDEIGVSLPELWWLLESADLFLSIDSGPGHFARFSKVPQLGIYHGHHVAHYALPRDSTVNLQIGGDANLTRMRRHSFGIVEGGWGDVVRLALQVLGPRRFVPQIGRDCVIRQLLDKLNTPSGALSELVDRGLSFGRCLEHLRGVQSPAVVGTGCIRSQDDWGAGFSDYLFGLFLQAHGGTLDVVDLDGNNCGFARYWTAPFPATIHQGDSLAFLRSWKKPIDLLYLDSMDTTVPGHEQHGLQEAQIGGESVKPGGLLLYDDTVYAGRWTGKGATGVPWLLSKGWKLEFSGYQTLLRKPTGAK